MENFSYCFGCKKTGEMAIVDAGFEPEKLLALSQEKQYRITKIFLTHVHYDHSGGADWLSKKTGASIFLSEKSRWKYGETEKHNWILPENPSFLSENQEISFGEVKGKSIPSPGHQNDHLLFQWGEYLCTGDTLFIGRIGRTDFVDSDPEAMQKTLQMIQKFPNNLLICPGHNYGEVPLRRLGEEKKKNPFLRAV